MIPVVVFAHRRADLLAMTLDGLRVNQVPSLIVFSDGPRGDADAAAVAKVRAVLRAVTWCPVEVHEHRTNLGLGRSVRRGVNEVLARHPAAIFVEEDLVCAPGAYSYLSAALDHYAADERVLSVTGWTHPLITPAGLGGQPYFDGKAECWVWGTWRRAWTEMDRPATELMRECSERGLDIRRYGSDLPKLAAEAGPRNLWAAGWMYRHLLTGGLCLRPPHSLCEHYGWDDRATTNASPDVLIWRNPPIRPSPAIPTAWPEPAEHPECARLWCAAVGDPELSAGAARGASI